jgi:hypothetical protein
MADERYCRWCEWQFDLEVAMLTDDRERAELATLKYRTVSVVTIAQMGGWRSEFDMLKEAYG